MSIEPANPQRTSPAPQDEEPKTSRWLRRYPPLVMFLLAVIITALVLPSALNLPQANPSTVLEYAPIPPEDDDPQTNEGAISELGLGSSGGLSTGAPASNPLPAAGGKGAKPTTKRCVGRPPRQTEDPNAPPCVPYFEGDNGGRTWQGVTGDEIVVLIYSDIAIYTGGSAGGELSPPQGYCDVDKAPNSDPGCHARDASGGASKGIDHYEVVVARSLSRFFNDRFQTYNRRVHVWIYFTNADTPATRRADAQANWDRLKPFAVIQAPKLGGYDDVYTEAMVKRRTMAFGALLPRPASYYREFAPMIWNFWPDVEHWADQFVSFICQEVAGKPVMYSGNGDNGKPRKYGFMHTTDERFPSLHLFATLVKSGIKNCENGQSVQIAADAPFSRHQYAVDSHPDAVTEAQQNVARMRGEGVTTIIWAGGYEAEHGKAAANSRPPWYPEIFVAGDQIHDMIVNGRFQQQDWWSHAVLMSNFLLEDKQEDAPCRQAYKEADPQGEYDFEACEVYRDFFMIFKGIQVAGPYLSPETLDQGQHAIPRASSTSPYAAACFFDPGDYTCVKDAREGWWDPSAPDPDGDPEDRGCWRLVEGGKRYLAWEWPGTDNAFQNRQDPCDNQGNSIYINPYGTAG